MPQHDKSSLNSLRPATVLKRAFTKKLFVGLLLAGAFGLVAGVVWASSSRDTQGGLPPVLDVPQSASDESNGVTLSISAARFSATATFVRFEADVAAWEAATGQKATQLSIAADAWGKGIAGGGAAVSLQDGPDSFARLDPVTFEPPYDVVVTRVDVLAASGTLIPVEGEWRLQLKPPADLRAALRTERLAGSPPVTTQDITLRATGGRRSTTETLITIEVSPANAVPLGEPRLASGDKGYASLLSSEGGTFLTYAFPPTPFGKPVRIEFESFGDLREDTNAAVRLDAGRAMAEQGVSGKDKEVVLFRDDHRHTVGRSPQAPVFKGTFFYLPFAHIGPYTALRLEIAANYDPTTTAFQVFGTNGAKLRIASMDDKYRKDADGNTVSDGFDLDIDVNPEDISGQLTILIGSAPTTVVRGLWQLDLAVDTSTP
ncbi:MAG: hypothetical protein AB7J35_01585 [Dehalococcoidia bacterium]